MTAANLLLNTLFQAAVAVAGWAAVQDPRPEMEQAGQSEQAPARVRRIYVPNDRIGELTERYPRLISIDRSEFDRLARQMRTAAVSHTPFLDQATLHASLAGPRLHGTAVLSVPWHHDTATLLKWPVSSWHISTARWGDRDASIGYAGNGQMGLIVPPGGSRTLDLDWSAPGKPVESGFLFEFQIPPSMRTVAILDLPAGKRVIATGGTATRIEHEGVAVRWQVEWAAAGRLSLMITDEQSAEPFAPLVTYSRHVAADIAQEATDIFAQFQLAVYHEPVRVLEFQVAPGVEVYGWSGLAVRDGQIVADRLQLILAEPLIGAGEITLHALGPGAVAERWTLPALLLDTKGSVCSGGSVRLNSAAGLVLTEVRSAPGVHASPGGMADPGGWTLQNVRPNDPVTAHALTAQNLFIPRINTLLQLGARVQAEVTAAWEIAAGETNAVQIRVPKDWSVQAVEGVSGTAVSRWFATEPGSDGLLTIQLAKTAYAGSQLAAQIRLSGPELDLSAANARAVLPVPRFRPVRGEPPEESVTVRSDPIWSAELADRQQLTVLTGSNGPMSEARPEPLAFRFDGPGSTATLAVARRAAEYSVHCDTHVEVAELFTTARYEFEIDWPQAQPDDIELQWTVPTRSSLRWELPAGAGSVRQLREGDQEGVRESWLVRLPGRSNRRIRFAAHWRTATAPRVEVPLPVTRLGTNTGTVLVRQAARLQVQAASSGLLPGLGSTRLPNAALERYEAWRYGLESPQLTLQVTQNDRIAVPSPWIDHARLVSTIGADGQAFHRIAYRFRSVAGSSFQARFPAKAQIRRLSSSGASVGQDQAGLLRVDCPAGLESCDLTIDYTMPDRPLGRWVSYDVQLPVMPYPVTRFTWEVAGPSDYAAYDWSAGLTPVPPRPAHQWGVRLFGPLWRPDAGGLFPFWDHTAWRAWIDGSPPPLEEAYRNRLANSLRDFITSVRPRDRTWARLCEHLDQFTEHRLVLDTVALARAGVRLDSEAGLSETALPEELFGLVSSAPLNLVRTEDGLLLTGRVDAESMAAGTAAALRVIRNDSGLAAAIGQATAVGSDSSGRFVRAGSAPYSLAATSDGTASVLAGVPGETTIRFESVGQPERLSLSMVQRSLVRQAAVIILVLLLFLGYRMRSGTFAWLYGCTGVLASLSFGMAIVVPESFALPWSTLGWGLLGVTVLSVRVVRVRRKTYASELRPTRRSTAVGGAAIATAWLLAGSLAVPAALQDNAAATQADDNKYLTAFVLFDPSEPLDQQQPARLLMPAADLERLKMISQPGNANPPVLVRATNVAGRHQDDRLELNIDIELELMTDQSSHFHLPLAGMVLRSAHLDDRPCVVEQAPGGIAVELAGAGRHELNLSAVVALEHPERGSYDLMIPPAARTRLDLYMPKSMWYELESAVSVAKSELGERQRLRAELAGDGTLRAQWSRQQPPPPRWRSDAATFLTWRGPYVELQTRAMVQVESGTIRQLVLDPDPGLELKAIRAPGLLRYFQRITGDRRQWVLDFERPVSGAMAIAIDCQGAYSAGDQLAVPAVRVMGGGAGRQLVAVAGAEDLEYRVVEPVGAAVVGPGDFQAVWQHPLLPTRLFFELTGAGGAGLIARSRPADTPGLDIQAHLRVIPGRNACDTKITASRAPVLWHELAIPPGFYLSDIRSTPGTYWRLFQKKSEGGSEAGPFVLWSGVPAGDAAPAIEIKGWAARSAESAPIPLIRPTSLCDVTGSMTIWRTREFNVVIEGETGLSAAGSRTEVKPPSSDLVAHSTYRFDHSDYSANWRIQNQPARVQTTVATRVLVGDSGAEWISVVDCQLLDGALQSLELIVPPTLPNQVQISGDGFLRREWAERDGSRVLRITLDQPRWQSYRLMLRASLPPETDSMIAIPIVRPRDHAKVDQLLLVLNATDHQLKINRMGRHEPVPVESFSSWFSEPITKSVAGSYSLTGPPGAVTVQPMNAGNLPARHTPVLERHQVWLGAANSLWVQSTVLVRARTSGPLVLRTPKESVVYDVRLNGQQIWPMREPGNELAVFLSENNRLYEIVVVSRRPVEPLQAIQSIHLSRLVKSDGPCVWAFSLPAGSVLSTASESATSLAATLIAEAAALTDQFEHLIEQPRTADNSERAAILSDLQGAIVTAAELARQAIDAAPNPARRQSQPPPNNDRDQLNQMLRRNQRLVLRAGTIGIRLRSDPPTSRSAQELDTKNRLGEVFAATAYGLSPLPGTPLFFVTRGRDLSLVAAPGPPNRSSRVGYSALLVALATIVFCSGIIATRRVRWLRWALILWATGFLWWWQLRAAPIGPLLMAAACILALAACLTMLKTLWRSAA